MSEKLSITAVLKAVGLGLLVESDKAGAVRFTVYYLDDRRTPHQLYETQDAAALTAWTEGYMAGQKDE